MNDKLFRKNVFLLFYYKRRSKCQFYKDQKKMGARPYWSTKRRKSLVTKVDNLLSMVV